VKWKRGFTERPLVQDDLPPPPKNPEEEEADRKRKVRPPRRQRKFDVRALAPKADTAART
jgi:hypothetical protein